MDDFCTQNGAIRLKNRITRFWKNQGYDVKIELINGGFLQSIRSSRTDVRSDMINGMPVRRSKPKGDRDVY